jgi:hypothetical protein
MDVVDEHRDPQAGWLQTPPSSRGPCARRSTSAPAHPGYPAPSTSEAPLIHSDLGVQFTPWAYTSHRSISSRGTGPESSARWCYDNAVIESFCSSPSISKLDTPTVSSTKSNDPIPATPGHHARPQGGSVHRCFQTELAGGSEVKNSMAETPSRHARIVGGLANPGSSMVLL